MLISTSVQNIIALVHRGSYRQDKLTLHQASPQEDVPWLRLGICLLGAGKEERQTDNFFKVVVHGFLQSFVLWVGSASFFSCLCNSRHIFLSDCLLFWVINAARTPGVPYRNYRVSASKKPNQIPNRSPNFEAGKGNWWRPCNHERKLLIGQENTLRCFRCYILP